jgi:putative flippase GtrA
MRHWSDHAFVVPAYGDSPFLAGCLESLAAQNLPSRIFVTTSTPSDFIATAARDAGAEYVVNPKREGIGADWNFALGVANRRYVTLAHQDDVYYSGFLHVTQNLFAANSDAALVFTGFREISDSGARKLSRISFVKHLLSAVILGGLHRIGGSRLKWFLSFGNPLPCSAVTLDFNNIPGFRFRTDLASNLDWDAWWRMYLNDHVFLYAKEKLVGRRHNDLTETSRLIRDGTRQKEDAEMFARIWPKPAAAVLGALYSASYGKGGKVVRFGLVGAALTLLNYAVYIAGLKLGLHYLMAATLGWAAGVVFSYFANKSFTFAMGRAFVWREFLALAAGYVLQLGLGLLGLYILIDGLGMGEVPAYWLNLIAMAAFSFFYMQHAVFRPRA